MRLPTPAVYLPPARGRYVTTPDLLPLATDFGNVRPLTGFEHIERNQHGASQCVQSGEIQSQLMIGAEKRRVKAKSMWIQE